MRKVRVCISLSVSQPSRTLNWDVGVMNLRAMQDMMQNQRLGYMFPFSSFEFATDVTFVVLSEGRKSTFFQVSFGSFAESVLFVTSVK
jgi:hypothetical protein